MFALAFGAALAPLALPSPAIACSGARVEFNEIRAEATRIVVGTIAAKRGDPEAPDAIRIQVEWLIRGSSPIELVLEPPVYMGCDGRIAEPIGSRVVIATGPRYFDAAPPGDLHPYWIIGANDVLDPVGVENADPAIRTLGDLVAAVGGELIPAPTASLADQAPADPGPGREAVVGDWAGVVWPITAAVGLYVVVLGGLVIRSRRGR